MRTRRLYAGALTLQTPEWSTELQPTRDDQGEVQYVTAGPPQPGVPFSLATEPDRMPVVLLVLPPDTIASRRLSSRRSIENAVLETSSTVRRGSGAGA